MSHLSMHFLGPYQIVLDGERAPRFRYKKARALLAYVAVEAYRAHHRGELAGLLWPDRSDRDARRSLRHVLHDLRQATGDSAAQPPFFLITSETVQFNVASSHWLDVAAFGFWLAVAGRGSSGAEADARAPPTENIAALKAAMILYRGSFLQDLPAVGSDGFEEWISLRREQFSRHARRALQRLMAAYEKQGEFGQAQEFAHRQLELEPWQEEAHRSLMRLLARSGQRSAALAQYRTCCRLLARELDVEPSDETKALYEQIRGGRFQEPSGVVLDEAQEL
jgi:DNA-binding SARP family transcriptional activator